MEIFSCGATWLESNVRFFRAQFKNSPSRCAQVILFACTAQSYNRFAVRLESHCHNSEQQSTSHFIPISIITAFFSIEFFENPKSKKSMSKEKVKKKFATNRVHKWFILFKAQVTTYHRNLRLQAHPCVRYGCLHTAYLFLSKASPSVNNISRWMTEENILLSLFLFTLPV